MLGIYCRISQLKEEGKDRSINDQKQLGLELAQTLNLEAEVFIEEGISGTLPIEKRPELEKLLQKIENGIITHMFIYMQDRLERNTEVRFYIKRILRESNARLFTETGEVDLHDEDSDLLGDIKSLFNAHSVRKTKKRVTSVLKRNAEEQRPHGPTPFGYKIENNKYEPDDYEAKVIELIFKYCNNGLSTQKIADILNHEQLKKRNNTIWIASSVHYILKNPRYKGERPYKTVQGGFVPIKPIVDSITWEQAQLALQDNKVYVGAPQTHNYLLKGLIRCNCCGLRYHGVVSQKNNHYACISRTKPHLKDSCDNTGINITKLDTLIWERFFVEKVLIDLVKKHSKSIQDNNPEESLKSRLADLNKQLEDNEAEFARIKKLAVKGFFSDEELESDLAVNKKDKTRIEIAIRNTQEALHAIHKEIYDTDTIDKELSKLKNETPFLEKKAIVNKFIKEIRINNEFKRIRVHEVEIYFNIPNMEAEVYLVPYKMHYALEIFEEILIPISDKFKKITEEERVKHGKNVSQQIKSVLNKK